MTEPANAALRPSRLPPLVHAVVLGLLTLSFISGATVWWGQTVQVRDLQTPVWLRGCLILHGGLNPFMCGLFGYLCCQHIRQGWELRANLGTGLVMEGLFAGLILTASGLYYAGAPELRQGLVWAHRVLGLLLPVALGAHCIAARHWVKKLQNNACS